jgi:hypothetical protein
VIWHCVIPYTDADCDSAIYHTAAAPETPAQQIYERFFAWVDADVEPLIDRSCADYAATASADWDAHHLVVLCPDDPASYHLFPSHFVDGHYRTPTGSISPTLADVVTFVQGGVSCRIGA